MSGLIADRQSRARESIAGSCAVIQIASAIESLPSPDRSVIVGSCPPPVYVVMTAIVIATITDLRLFKIHNLLTIPLVLSGLVYHAATGGANGLLTSTVGMFTGFGIFFVFFLIGGMGGGDVKLMA